METLQRTANRGSLSTGYDIDNSLKFEPDNTEILKRTYGSGGNVQKWTFSTWIKRTELVGCRLFGCKTNGNVFLQLSGDKLRWYVSGNDQNTEAVYRDTSAWYHIILQFDSAQATASNRTKIYVNGVQQTLTGSYVNQNTSTIINNAVIHGLGGREDNNTEIFAGYMAETYFIDNQALEPSDFGEYDEDSGIWKPKEYEGTFGTTGWYLDFKDAANLGDDVSGNNNDWTETNITSADQATDTPTNNFCTWSPLWVYATNRTISEGGTKLTGSSAWGGCKGTIGVTNGKWYWEHKASGNETIVGWQTDGDGNTATGNAHDVLDTIALYQDANFIWIKDSTSGRNDTSASGTNVSGQIIGFALDLDSSPQTATFYRNGSAIASNVNIDGLTGKTLFPFISQYNHNTEANFGGYTSFSISSAASDANGYGTFEYAPPSGYYALCTKNLAEFG